MEKNTRAFKTIAEHDDYENEGYLGEIQPVAATPSQEGCEVTEKTALSNTILPNGKLSLLRRNCLEIPLKNRKFDVYRYQEVSMNTESCVL
jgi:hypothetical protein